VNWLAVIVTLVTGVAVGAVLGLVFFGGLWWTSRRLAETARPALLVSISLLVRLLVVAVVLVLLARIGPLLLLAAMVGLLAMRLALTRAVASDRLAASALPAGSPEGRT
jgi:F1F0 ATPase subunit 2